MRISALSAALVCLALVACATTERVVVGTPPPAVGTETTLPSGNDAASFCEAKCSREQACDEALDTQTCENQCTNANAAVFPRLRGDVVDLIVACFEEKDCKTVLGSGFVGACTSDAIASVAPSAAASAFCDSLFSAKKSCTGSAQTKADCLTTAKLYDDEAIAEAQNCAKRGCSEIDACVGAVFGAIGGGAAAPGGTSGDGGATCSGSFPSYGSCASCAETSCCAEAKACAADASCNTVARYCTAAESASLCSQYYASASPASQQLASALFACASSKCSGTCRIGGS